MKNGNKKILIIVIIVIMLLAIIGGIFAFLFLATDIFKSDKELFGKYIYQNTEHLNKMLDSQTQKIYQSVKEMNTYETDVDVRISHSEGGEVSNPFNNLSFQLTSQKDGDYIYKMAQVAYQDQEALQIEGIKDGEIYGVRFSDVFRQFISVRNEEAIMQVPNNLELDAEMLKNIMGIINGDTNLLDKVITKDEINQLKEKYTKIIFESFENATYSSQKDAVITVNNNTINANAYTASLTSEQVQNMIVQLLNNLKTDDIIIGKLETLGITTEEEIEAQIDEILENLGIDQKIPAIKVTVYQEKGVTIRTLIEIDLNKITIDNTEQEGNSATKIQIENLNDEQVNQQNIEISKTNTETKEDYNIKFEIINGENTYTFTTDLSTENSNNNITTEINNQFKTGITTIDVNLTADTKQYIEEKIELDETNNVLLNDLDDNTRKGIISRVETQVPERVTSRLDTLAQLLFSKSLEQIIEEMAPDQPEEPETGNPSTGTGESTEPQLSQVEVNRFNAKFEFYTGESVSAENVRTLLNEAKTNLASVQITSQETEEPENTHNQEEPKQIFTLNIEKDVPNEELANSVLEQIIDDAKYRVSITYNEQNQLIQTITITELD